MTGAPWGAVSVHFFEEGDGRYLCFVLLLCKNNPQKNQSASVIYYTAAEVNILGITAIPEDIVLPNINQACPFSFFLLLLGYGGWGGGWGGGNNMSEEDLIFLFYHYTCLHHHPLQIANY